MNSKSEEERNNRTKEIKEQIEKMELTFKNNINAKEEEIKKLNDVLSKLKVEKENNNNLNLEQIKKLEDKIKLFEENKTGK